VQDPVTCRSSASLRLLGSVSGNLDQRIRPTQPTLPHSDDAFKYDFCTKQRITQKSMTSRIVATSRQTRFNPLVQGDASEVDLNDVNIAIGEREILVDARIRLKSGVKYGLIGRWVLHV
jgi:hypothetical protein